MKHVMNLLFAIAIMTFYVVEYEEHTWSPCKDDYCYAIHCPSGGCVTKGQTVICPDKMCVEESLSKNGTEHLTGVWEVTWIEGGMTTPTARKLNVSKKYTVE